MRVRVRACTCACVRVRVRACAWATSFYSTSSLSHLLSTEYNDISGIARYAHCEYDGVQNILTVVANLL